MRKRQGQGIETIGKADRATRVEPQGIASIDSLESTCRMSAMGKGRENEDAGHEAEGTCFVNAL
jgi:hypothetical protein